VGNLEIILNPKGEKTMYVYESFQRGLWTVGFYKPNGEFEPESDHDNIESAADRVHYLNGGDKTREKVT
jgi:hypothetical protein